MRAALDHTTERTAGPKRYVGVIPGNLSRGETAGMKKRILATFLWFYAGWYAGAILAEFLGVSQLLGPIIGMAAAALVAGDPRRIIWSRPGVPATPATIAGQEPS